MGGESGEDEEGDGIAIHRNLKESDVEEEKEKGEAVKAQLGRLF